MGYSIPSSKAKKIIENLSTLTTRETVPEAERGYLGVQVKNIDQQTATTFGMPKGIFIYKFTEGSTAQNSGLQERDIITALDGQGVTNYDELSNLLTRYRAGETVKVTVQRPNGNKYDEVTVDVVLGASTDPKKSDSQNNSGAAGNNGSSGSSGSDSSTPESQDNGQSQPDQSELWKQFEEFFNQYQR